MEQAKKEFYTIPTEILFSKLSPNAKILYLIMTAYRERKEMIPSYGDLSKEMGMSAITIRNLIKEMEAFSILEIQRKGKRNVYTFNK